MALKCWLFGPDQDRKIYLISLLRHFGALDWPSAADSAGDRPGGTQRLRFAFLLKPQTIVKTDHSIPLERYFSLAP
jgi:hypothetical protein